MAVTFKTKTQGFSNMWTQIKDIVSTKSLYNEEDYTALSPDKRQQYLLMLYENNDALQRRMSMTDYESEYGTTDTRYSLLSAAYFDIDLANKVKTPEYQAMRDQAVDARLNALNVDAQNGWVDYVVRNNYNGDYAQFLREYTGENAKTYQDLASTVPLNQNLYEDTFKAGIEEVQARRDKEVEAYDAEQSDVYNKTLTSVREMLRENALKKAYDDATAVTKLFNTAWQTAALWAAEPIEIIEGIGDAVAGAYVAITGGVVNSDNNANRAVTEFIKTDWWDPETWLGVDESASYLSRFAGNNMAKFVYTQGISIIDMAPMIAVNIANGAAGGTLSPLVAATEFLYYTASAGKTLESELNDPANTTGEAIWLTLGSTAIEVATEKISGNSIFGGGIFDSWEKLGAKNVGLKILTESIGEGAEEGISEIGSEMWRHVVTGESSLGTLEHMDQVIQAIMGGALIGGIMAGGGAGIDNLTISSVSKHITAKNGSTMTLSGGKLRVVQNFILRTAKRIESGKKVSERTRRWWNSIKDLNIVDVTAGKFTNAALKRLGKATTDEKAMERFSRFSDTLRYEVNTVEGTYDKTIKPKFAKNAKTDGQSISDEANALREKAKKPGTAENVKKLENETGKARAQLAKELETVLSSEDIATARSAAAANIFMTIARLYGAFGSDVLVAGTKLFAEFEERTIADVIDFLERGSISSPVAIDNKATDERDMLSDYFAGANFEIVKAKASTELRTKYDAVESMAAMYRKTLKAFNKGNQKIRLFVTDTGTVSTCFFANGIMFLNANWLQETGLERVKSVVACKYLAENARKLICNGSYKGVTAMIDDACAKMEGKSRSDEIIKQELVFTMVFSNNNDLLKQLLLLDNKHSGVNELLNFLDDLRKTYADTNVQRAVNIAISNIHATSKSVFTSVSETESEGETELIDDSIKKTVDTYKKRQFATVPFITGLPENLAKVELMLLHMEKTYGFNRKVSGVPEVITPTSTTGLLSALLDQRNYSEEGYAKLMAELDSYRVLHEHHNYSDTLPKNKSNKELLNYYLENVTGVMVFDNGVIAASELTTKLFNIANLNNIASAARAMISASKDKPLCKVGDIINLDLLPPDAISVADIPVYVTFDSRDGYDGQQLADLSGIVINLPHAKDTPSKTFGMQALQLSDDGTLLTNPDGSYKVENSIAEVDGLGYTIAHEVVHCIGVRLGMHGTFDDNGIASVYARVLQASSPEARSEIINSIRTWLFENGKVKNEHLSLARNIDEQSKAGDPRAAKIIEDWFADIEKLDYSDKNKIKSKFRALAAYLYFTGFAHEMLARGEVSGLSRENTIKSKQQRKVIDNTVGHVTTLITDGSDLAFVRCLDGQYVVSVGNSLIDAELAKIEMSPENVTRRVYRDLSVNDLAEGLGASMASELIDPSFWARAAADAGTTNSNKHLTRAALITDIERRDSVGYDSITKSFSKHMVSYNDFARQEHVLDSFNKPAFTTTRDGKKRPVVRSIVFCSDGSIRSTKDNTSTYGSAFNDDNIDVIAIRKGDGLVLRINKYNESTGEYRGRLAVNGHEILAGKPMRFIVSDKCFTNLNAANNYLSTIGRISDETDFGKLFGAVVGTEMTEGEQLEYSGTVYVTTDGKVYSGEIDMYEWFGLATKEFGRAYDTTALLGNKSNSYSAQFGEPVTYALQRRLDEYHIVRLYQSGDGWVSHGIPNIAQDRIINQLKAERMGNPDALTPYVELADDRIIETNATTRKTRIIRSAEISDGDSGWSAAKWMTGSTTNVASSAIKRILTIYNITSLKELECLGFSEEFINKIRNPKGITTEDIITYITDGSNTKLSRDILTENTGTMKDTGELHRKWSDNPDIHTVDEAKAYLELAAIYAPILGDSALRNKVFSSVIDLQLEFDKEITIFGTINGEVHAAELENIDDKLRSAAYIQILNMNSKQPLRICYADFVSALKQLQAISKKFDTKEESLVYTNEDGDEYINPKIKPTGTEEFEKVENKIDAENSPFHKALLSGDTTKALAILGDTENNDVVYLEAIARALPYDKAERDAELDNIIAELESESDDNLDHKYFLLELARTYRSGFNNAQRTTIDKLKRRIAKYDKMPEGDAKNKEFAALNRHYSQLRKTAQRRIYENSEEYQKALEAAIPRGHDARLDSNARQQLGQASIEERAARRLDRLNEAYAEIKADPAAAIRSHEAWRDTFVEMGKIVNGMEKDYIGYKNIAKSLMELISAWTNVYKATYLGENIPTESAARAQFFAAARTDIINDINEYLDYITQRETTSITVSDNLKPLNELNTNAISFYEFYADNPDKFVDVWETDTKLKNFLARQAGKDGDALLQHLQRLYDSLTGREYDEGGSSKSRKITEDSFNKIFARMLGTDKSDASPENQKLANEYAKKAAARVEETKLKQKESKVKLYDLTSQKYAVERVRGGKVFNFLAKGKEVSRTARYNAVKEKAKDIKDFRWNVNRDYAVYVIDTDKIFPFDLDPRRALKSNNPLVSESGASDVTKQYNAAKVKRDEIQKQYNDAHAEITRWESFRDKLKTDGWLSILDTAAKEFLPDKLTDDLKTQSGLYRGYVSSLESAKKYEKQLKEKYDFTKEEAAIEAAESTLAAAEAELSRLKQIKERIDANDSAEDLDKYYEAAEHNVKSAAERARRDEQIAKLERFFDEKAAVLEELGVDPAESRKTLQKKFATDWAKLTTLRANRDTGLDWRSTIDDELKAAETAVSSANAAVEKARSTLAQRNTERSKDYLSERLAMANNVISKYKEPNTVELKKLREELTNKIEKAIAFAKAKEGRYTKLAESLAAANAEYEAAEREYVAKDEYKPEVTLDPKTGKYVIANDKPRSQADIDKATLKRFREDLPNYLKELLKDEKGNIIVAPYTNDKGVTIDKWLAVGTTTGAKRTFERVGKRLLNEYGTDFKDLLVRDDKDKPIRKMKKSVKVGLAQLPRGTRWRTTQALAAAYASFMNNPETDRSIDLFKSDVDFALETRGEINAFIPGDSTQASIKIAIPEKYNQPIEAGGTPFGEKEINEQLKHVFNGDLLPPSKTYTEMMDQFLQYAKAVEEQRQAEKANVDSLQTPGDYLRHLLYHYRRAYRKGDWRWFTPFNKQFEEINFRILNGPDGEAVLYDKNNKYIGVMRPTIYTNRYYVYNLQEDTLTRTTKPARYELVFDIHYKTERYTETTKQTDKSGYKLNPDWGKVTDATKYVYEQVPLNKTEESAIREYTTNRLSGGELSKPETVDPRELPPSLFNQFMLARVHSLIDSGEVVHDYDTDTIIDTRTGKTVLYNFSDMGDYESSNLQFEEAPSEDDFTDGSSKAMHIEDDGIAPILFDNVEEKPLRRERGTYSETEHTSTNNLSDSTKHMLQYIPRKWESDGVFATKEFLEDNNDAVTAFTNDVDEMTNFITYLEGNPDIQLNSPQAPIIFALLGKVMNLSKLQTGSDDLHNRAVALFDKLRASGARILGMSKGIKDTGATPVEQIIGLCSKYLHLDDKEKQFLSDCATVQSAAIANGDYKRVSEVMDQVIALVKKHQAELPASTNIFAKGLTTEERTTRWHNLAEYVTTWKYFAMLGAPTTFFMKNITSNGILTALDFASEMFAGAIAKVTPGNTRLSKDYSIDSGLFDKLIVAGDDLSLLSEENVRNVIAATVTNDTDLKQINVADLTNELNDYIKSRHKVHKRMPSATQVSSQANKWLRKRYYQYRLDTAATAESKALTNKFLVENGLIDALMAEEVSKYDSGFEPSITGIRNIALNSDTKFDDLSEKESSYLVNVARHDAPFGNNKFLNAWYKLIFSTMDKGDRWFIRPKVIKLVGRLVASNMTAAEIDALQNGTDAQKEAAKAKFDDLVAYAFEDATKTYLRSNTDFQKKIMRLFKDKPVAQLIFGTLVPFPRMAINVTNTILSYSPVGFIKALSMQLKNEDAFTKIRVQKELGKAATGTILLGVGVLLGALGLLDFDDDDEYGGIQLKICDFYFALDDLMPAMTPFVIGATMTNRFTETFWSDAYSKRNVFARFGASAYAATYSGVDALLDGTLLGEVIEIFGGNKTPADVAVDTFDSFINQFIPSIFRHMSRTIDPTKKQYSSNKGLKIIQKIAAAIPGTSLLVPSKIDPYTGNSLYQNAESNAVWAHILSFINAFAPAKVTSNMESFVERESVAVGAATTGPSKKYRINGVEYTMSDELYRDYQSLRARLYSNYAQETISTAKYQNMSIEQKRAKLKQLQNKATETARKQLNIGK